MLAYLRSVAGAEHGFYGATKFSGKARSFSSSRLAKTQAGVLLWVAEWTFTIALTTKEYALLKSRLNNANAGRLYDDHRKPACRNYAPTM